MKNKTCKHCGAHDFAEYRQGPDGVIYTKSKDRGDLKKRELLTYDICIKCGTVDRIYIKKK